MYPTRFLVDSTPPRAPLAVCLCPLIVFFMSSVAQQLDIGHFFAVSVFPLRVVSSVWPLSYSFFLSFVPFVSFITFLCGPDVSPSAGHMRGRIVPANSNFVPQELGLRPQRLFASRPIVFFSFFLRTFFSYHYSPLFFLFILFFGCTSTYHGLVHRITSLQIIRDGIPQLVSIVPFVYYCYYAVAPTSYIRILFFRPSNRFQHVL